MAQNKPESMLWDWGEAVFMLSLVDLYRVNGDSRFRDYYQSWIDHFLSLGYKHLIISSDRCPPALAALALFQEKCDEAYGNVVLDVLSYLYHDTLRTEDGGINHLGVSDVFGVSLWLDSLFMFGNLLSRWGEFANDAKALDELAGQISIFSKHLQSAGGFFKHAHNWSVAEQDDDVFWARGNAWVTAATYEYLRVRKARGESDSAAEAVIKSQVDAAIAAQDQASGLWWTILNKPGETYLETSASALFVVGLARGYRYGFLDDSVLPTVKSGLAGIKTRIVDDEVVGTSGPTSVGNFDYYAAIETDAQIHYGVGAVVLALLETAGLPVD